MTRPLHSFISDILHLPHSGKHRESCSLSHDTPKQEAIKPEIGSQMIGVMGEHTATHDGWIQQKLGMPGEAHGGKAHDGQRMCQRHSVLAVPG